LGTTNRRSAVSLAAGRGHDGRPVKLALGPEFHPGLETSMSAKIEDVLIIGGGPAGLSAALYLGRARKTVRVIDAGSPRHAVAEGVHNLLSREGIPPAELRRIAWGQMAQFPTVSRTSEARVSTLLWTDGRWRATTETGEVFEARTALLATGMIDIHPEIQGFAQFWGASIHHCPFCHGWEMRDEPLALQASGPMAAERVQLFRGWSADVVLTTHGVPLEPEQRAELARLEVPFYEQKIVALAGEGSQLDTLIFDDGTRLARRGLFTTPVQRQVPLVADLNLAADDMGFVKTDFMQRTSMPMLWSAGDLSARMQQVGESAAAGGRAAGSIVHSLNVPGFASTPWPQFG
jgi:thioredoxin reductase